jgi:hypothetical protein
VTVSGGYAYIVDELSGMHVIDVSNPAEPERAGGNGLLRTDGGDRAGILSRGVTVFGDKVFVAAGVEGLTILHTHRPPQIEQILRLSNGSIGLRVSGPPGVVGRVQRTVEFPPLWDDLLPLTFGEEPLEVTGGEAGLAPTGFYRLAVP